MQPISLRARITPYVSWSIVALLLCGALLAMLPELETKRFALHVATFISLALFLAAGFWGLGYLALLVSSRTREYRIALPIGMGLFALSLIGYLKFTLSPVLPLVLLSVGAFTAVKVVLHHRKHLSGLLQLSDVPWLTLLLGLSVIGLLFNAPSGGLLAFPRDFDSNFIHVLFPKRVLHQGYYSNPDWLRGIWLPQLTHSIYIFILSLSNDLFLKTINLICLVHIGVFFLVRRTVSERVSGAILFALLTAANEFRDNCTATNLDAVFALFVVSAFDTMHRFIETRRFSLYVFATVLAGFSAGQKHFGLMFSVPLLLVGAFVELKPHILPLNKLQLGKQIARVLPSLKKLLLCAVLFVVTFSLFYIHNLLEGNSLLFPFIGSKVNTYGWDSEDLRQMIEDTIPHWGYSKTALGFLMLPAHLMLHPEKYQFAKTGSLLDFSTSASLVLCYLVAVIGCIFSRLRRSSYFLLALIIVGQAIAWYCGSQVIRYLYPVLIVSSLLASLLLQHGIVLLARMVPVALRSVAAAMILLGSIYAVSQAVRQPALPIPLTAEERFAWIKQYMMPSIGAYQWLREHVTPHNRVVHIGNGQIMANFPDLILCGDWFARFRYNRFLKELISFREWPEVQRAFAGYPFSHIFIAWDTFAPHSSRPKDEAAWQKAFPESTRECLRHVFYDGAATDIYEIKQSCREK
jgi:hypothetical protein